VVNFSIVIVTYGRTSELSQLLKSITKQTLIDELEKIIVVDNHPKSIGEKIVDQYLNDLDITYIKNNVNSLTSGRSKGSKVVESEIVLFLDDDVTLNINYFKEMIDFYEAYPDANGMQGMFDVGNYSKLKNSFNAFFWLFNYTKDEYKVYPSIQASYSGAVHKITKCEWFSGTNFSYKRQVIKEIDFDLNLLKYCEGEDIDYSYRVYKGFGKLYMNPKCKVIHHASSTSREMGKEFTIMQEIYGVYLLNKLFPKCKTCKLKYVASRIGKLLLLCVEIIRLKPYSFKNLTTYFSAVKRSVLNGDINKFNKEIK
jgi:glucosyl-dolichyl phosphate glucuronosyltransferase